MQEKKEKSMFESWRQTYYPESSTRGMNKSIDISFDQKEKPRIHSGYRAFRLRGATAASPRHGQRCLS